MSSSNQKETSVLYFFYYIVTAAQNKYCLPRFADVGEKKLNRNAFIRMVCTQFLRFSGVEYL